MSDCVSNTSTPDEGALGRIVSDPANESRQRVRALEKILTCFVTLPIALEQLVEEHLEQLEILDGSWIDMSIASSLPLKADVTDSVFMIALKINTPVGASALYVVRERHSQQVTQAAIYPSNSNDDIWQSS